MGPGGEKTPLTLQPKRLWKSPHGETALNCNKNQKKLMISFITVEFIELPSYSLHKYTYR